MTPPGPAVRPPGPSSAFNSHPTRRAHGTKAPPNVSAPLSTSHPGLLRSQDPDAGPRLPPRPLSKPLSAERASIFPQHRAHCPRCPGNARGSPPSGSGRTPCQPVRGPLTPSVHPWGPRVCTPACTRPSPCPERLPLLLYLQNVLSEPPRPPPVCSHSIREHHLILITGTVILCPWPWRVRTRLRSSCASVGLVLLGRCSRQL